MAWGYTVHILHRGAFFPGMTDTAGLGGVDAEEQAQDLKLSSLSLALERAAFTVTRLSY